MIVGRHFHSRCWGESYTLDQWANLTAIGVASSAYNGCTQESLSVTAATNNRLSSAGFSYDLSGNTLADGVNSYAWNAESEMKSAAGVNYTYDGDGNRVQKSSGKIYWYGAGKEILDESDASGNFTNEYVFFGGKRIAMRNVTSGSIFYYANDMLGSTSKIVQDGQTTPCYDADFYPYGGERVATNTCPQNYKFEGKERDTETGNDDFGARYYSSRIGRWLSSDWSSVPVPVPYANLTNPQTLNLYAMVSDNPESFSDLDGHCGNDNNWWECFTDNMKTSADATKQAATISYHAFTDLANQTAGDLGAGVGLIVGGIASGNSQEMMEGVNKIGPTATLLVLTEGLGEPETGAGTGLKGLAGDGVKAVPDSNIVVRGGTKELPTSGTYSGAHGATVEEAAGGVPHGTIRTSSAGEIRAAGGTVRSAPEPAYPGGPTNERHVSITGGQNTFSEPKPNPVPRNERVPSAPKP
ncbi:MAG: RHS repeat-associated core domain-containing protein [Acidobacteriia bacterium]|nr:RHS repeat-associated core domain-containing protein [Terriglobia bacterium]